MNEKEIIRGLRKGSYSSYEILFKLYYARFVHYAEAIVGDYDVAKDLVQEAFIKVWLNRDTLREELSISNYLYVLVRRASLNFLRDRKMVVALDDEMENLSNEESLSVCDNRIDCLRAAVESLPDKRKAVFKLSKEEGLHNKEIASHLNLSEKTVERHMTLAFREIRNKFKS